MKRFPLLLSILLVFFLSTSTWALPIVNTAGDGEEDLAGGSPYAYYQNSGEWMFTQAGNNEGNAANLALAQSLVISWLDANTVYDTTGFTLVPTSGSITVTGVDAAGDPINLGAASSGTFSVDTSIYPGGIEFYALKAADWYAFYFQEGGETFGSWSTYDLWLEKGKGETLEISHWTGYNARAIPEPSTILLLGIGLFGLAGIGRHKIKK